MLPEDSNVDGLDVSEILTQTDSLKPVYPIEVMRKYVAYSKRIVPIMTPVAQKIIQDSYLRIRGMGSEGSVPITARQLEGYVRLSEASARMRLSHTVTDQDANNAAELIEAYLNKIAGNGDGTYDIDKITSGVTSRDRNKKDAVLNIMREYGEDGLTIDLIVQYGLNMGLSSIDVEHALKTLNDVGDVYKSPAGVYKLTS